MPETPHQIAQNPLTKPEKLAKLSNNLDPEVRKFVVQNCSTATETLSNMIYDANEEVLILLAKNVKLGKISLSILCQNKNPKISDKAKLTYISMFGEVPKGNHTELQKLDLAIQNLENQKELVLRQKRLLKQLIIERQILQN